MYMSKQRLQHVEQDMPTIFGASKMTPIIGGVRVPQSSSVLLVVFCVLLLVYWSYKKNHGVASLFSTYIKLNVPLTSFTLLLSSHFTCSFHVIFLSLGKSGKQSTICKYFMPSNCVPRTGKSSSCWFFILI